MENKNGVHPIILNNKKDPIHWFDTNGNFVAMFHGIDGKTYMAKAEPKDWPPEIWELYEKEGITIKQPTPVEDIHYPKKSSD